MTLTPEQLRAVVTEGTDLCVRAGAGSGKTRVLVERAVHLVTRAEKPVPLSAILAITFTEKAAREMKERLAKALAKSGLSDARALVEGAYVSTIHGFCARLLRENAVEAGLDPAFEVLDEHRSQTFRTEAIAATAEHWTAERPDDLRALERLSLPRPEEDVAELHETLRAAGIPPADLPVAGSDGDPLVGLPETLAGLPEALVGLPEALVGLPEALADLEGLRPGLAGRAAERAGDALRAGFELVAAGVTGLARARPLLDRLRAACGGRLPKVLKPVLAPIKDEIVPRALAAAAEETARVPLAALRAFLGDFDESYRRRKTAAGALDFSDLEIRALELLRGHEEIREGLRARFGQILVDEYQDVNRVQDALIRLLRTEGNHFVVGDVKQSIYGFRHAEPALFKEHAEAVGEEGLVTLADNFRSRPGLVGFANHCFSALFLETDLVEWTPLTAAAEFAPSDGADVTVLLTEGETAPEYRRAEARAVARRIRETVAEEAIRIARGGESQGHAVRYGDVAVLLRALTDVKIYERAFEDEGVPFYVVKGRGFYEAREIVDLMRLLQSVRNPRDEVALAAALRSPFAGLSEDGLLALIRAARRRKGGRLADLLDAPERVEGLSASDAERWAGFAALLARLRVLAVRGTLRELIEAALAESGYELAVHLLPGGRRRAANLRKAVALAEAFERSAGLDRFLSALTSFRVREVRETEAPTGGESEDVVKILTIHAAKGLEFPVVYLADLSRKPAVITPAALVSAEGTGVRVQDPPGSKAVATLTYERLREDRNRREREEDLRLLYVAVTRAEEHLVLCAREGEAGRPPGSFREVLGRTLSLDVDGTPYGVDGWTIHVVRPDVDPAPTRGAVPLSFRYRDLLARAEPLPEDLAGEARREHARDLLARADAPRPVPDGSDYENTVTELLVHAECPVRYHLRYRLGVPEMPDESFAVSGTDEGEGDERPGLDELPPREVGIAVHEVLRLNDPHGGRSLSEEAAERVRVLTGRESPAVVREVAEMARAFYEHEVGREVMAADPAGVRREVPFLVRWRDEVADAGLILRGKIDLLYPRPDGTIRIVDYKTGKVPKDGEAPRPYRIQLAVYAMALRGFLGREVEACLVYLAPGEARVVPVDVSGAVAEETDRLARDFALALAEDVTPIRGEEADCRRCPYFDFCDQAERAPRPANQGLLPFA